MKKAFWMVWTAATLLLVYVLLSSCSGGWRVTAETALAAAVKATKGVSVVAEGAYREKCMRFAKTCMDLPCPKLEACQAERKRVNDAIKRVHRANQGMMKLLPIIESIVETK